MACETRFHCVTKALCNRGYIRCNRDAPRRVFPRILFLPMGDERDGAARRFRPSP
jgi:hypothetical protein